MDLKRLWRTRRERAACPAPVPREITRLANSVKGFLSEQEGVKLYELAFAAASRGPCLEIGSYCGKSALFLAAGCRARGKFILFSVDHHSGSEEQQRGEEYFDLELYDAVLDRVDTLPHFLTTIRRAGLTDWIIPIIGNSAQVARNWGGSNLGLVFIDGGHSKTCVEDDFKFWGTRVVPNGWVCFHDIYPDPVDGGQAPFVVFEKASSERTWRFDGLFGSLGVLQRR
jgi:MMP 1-O-methyltransferase